MKKFILLGFLSIFAIFGIIQAKDYYNDRYVVDDVYYVKVSDNIDMNLEDLKDKSGKVVDTGKDYSFIGYNDQGEQKIIEFSMSTDDPKDLLHPGVYLRVDHSKSLVLSYHVIDENYVPDSVVSKLN